MSFLVLAATGLPGAAQPQAEKTISEIAERSSSAVVFLQVRDASGEIVDKASGFAIDPAGVIVTNFHVIEGRERVEVKLATGEVFDAVGVVDYNPRRDIALLKIRATNLPTVELGDSDQVKEGERVVAIGNPLGLERSVSEGIVSAWRLLEGTRFLQISAPISPGSSGGPLFNMDGEVVGVTTAGITGFGAQNLNLAVPINYVVPLLATEVNARLPVSKEGAPGAGGDRQFIVVHDHGDEFRTTCTGTLRVREHMIAFYSPSSGHGFSEPPAAILEVAVNVAYGAKAGAFHIRLKNLHNFNFFAVKEDGSPIPPQTVVFVVKKVLERAAAK